MRTLIERSAQQLNFSTAQRGSRRSAVRCIAWLGRLSLALESIPKGNRFLFHPDSVHDGDYGVHLEHKSRQHRAELVNRQRIIAIQHHIPAPVTHSYYEQLDLKIGGRLPLSENLQDPLLGILVFDG